MFRDQDSSEEGPSKEQQLNALNKGSPNAVSIVNVANTATNINCQLNGNGDNSNPGELVNCLENIAQNQQQSNQNEQNVDRNDANKLSKDICHWFLDFTIVAAWQSICMKHDQDFNHMYFFFFENFLLCIK